MIVDYHCYYYLIITIIIIIIIIIVAEGGSDNKESGASMLKAAPATAARRPSREVRGLDSWVGVGDCLRLGPPRDLRLQSAWAIGR